MTGRPRCLQIRRTAGTILVLLFAILTPLAAVSATEQEMPKVLQVGFSSNVFPDLDRRDAQVAMELWSRELTRRIGISAKVTIYRDTTAMRTAFRKGQLHIVTLSSVEYLQVRNSLPLVPAFVAACKTGRRTNQVLIVRRDSGIGSFKALRGKVLALPPAQQQETGRIWLDVITMRETGETSGTYFRELKEARKASQAVMAVFFRQADAAVINRGVLEGSMALNPQLGRDLVVIQESQSLLEHFTCVPVNINARLKKAMEDAAFDMHQNTVGRQVLTLFQIDKIVSYQASYLDGIEALLAEQQRLKARRRRS